MVNHGVVARLCETLTGCFVCAGRRRRQLHVATAECPPNRRKALLKISEMIRQVEHDIRGL
jgi:hypothetical protein